MAREEGKGGGIKLIFFLNKNFRSQLDKRDIFNWLSQSLPIVDNSDMRPPKREIIHS